MLNKLWVIILCFIVGGVIGFAGTKILVTPQYSASSMIYILPKTRSVTSLADIKMGSQLTSDFGILAKSRPVIEEVNKNLKLDYSYEQLASMVQATNQSDTRILRFTVTDTDPIEAKKIANELANVAAERVAYVIVQRQTEDRGRGGCSEIPIFTKHKEECKCRGSLCFFCGSSNHCTQIFAE